MKWTTLEEISSLISKGTTPTTLGHSFVSEGIPFLRAEDVIGTAINPKAVAYYISAETDKILSRSRLQPGDLLITIAGTLGRVGYVPMNAPPLNCNQAVAFVRLDSQVIDLSYAGFACQAQIADLLSLRKIGTIGNLNLEQIRQFKIPFPPLCEQRRIAGRLEQADRLRRTRRYAVGLTDTFLPAAFLEIFGEPSESANRFPHSALGEVSDFIDYRGIAPNKSPRGVRLITARNVKRGYFEIEPQEFIPADEYDSWMTRGIPRPGDVLFTTEGHTLGSAAMLPPFEKAALAQRLIALQPARQITSAYLLHLVVTPSFQRAVVKRSTGSAARGISSKNLAEIPIPVPPLPLQQKFAALVERVERLRAVQREALRQAEHLFASLLHRAFSA